MLGDKVIAREDAPYRVNPYSADRRTPPRTTVHLATCHCVHAGSKWRSFSHTRGGSRLRTTYRKGREHPVQPLRLVQPLSPWGSFSPWPFDL